MYIGALAPITTVKNEGTEDVKKFAIMSGLILAAAWAFAPNKKELTKYAVGFGSLATAAYVIKGDGIKFLGRDII